MVEANLSQTFGTRCKMAKSWKEVEASDAFNSLSGQDKFLAKKEYWDTVVEAKPEFASLVPEDQTAAKKEFFGGTLVSDLPEESFRSPDIALKTIGDTIGVIGKSTLKLGEGMVQPILHPLNTARDLGNLAGSAILKLIPGAQPNEKYIDALGKFYKDRYGSIDALGKTIAEDPAGFLADASLIAGAGISGVRTAGRASEISSLSKFADISGKTPNFQKAGEAIGRAIPKVDLSPETRVFKLYREAFPDKKGTIKDLKNAKTDAVNAVKAISENFPDEGLVNPLTGDVFVNKPTNRYEALIALDNAKKKIWDRATKLSSGATESGALIDLESITGKAAKRTIDDFGGIAAKTTKSGVSRDIIAEANLIGAQGKVTPTQAEKFLKQLYDDSQKLMQSGDFTQYSKKDFYKNLYGDLRKATDDSIVETLGRAGYSDARSQYAAVRGAEDAIKNGANKYLQSTNQGQTGALADFWAIEELISGNVAKAATVKGTKEILKYFKDKDRKVDMLFSEAEKLKKRPDPVVSAEAVDRIMKYSKDFQEADIVPEKPLGIPAPRVLEGLPSGEKRIGLPNLPAEKMGQTMSRTEYGVTGKRVIKPKITREPIGNEKPIPMGEIVSLEKMPISKLEEYIQNRYSAGARQRELDMLETLYQKRIAGKVIEYKGRKVR